MSMVIGGVILQNEMQMQYPSLIDQLNNANLVFASNIPIQMTRLQPQKPELSKKTNRPCIDSHFKKLASYLDAKQHCGHGWPPGPVAADLGGIHGWERP